MGLSQPDLAGILGTSKNYVSNWEVGRTRPDMNIIPALCRAIGISIAEFSAAIADSTIFPPNSVPTFAPIPYSIRATRLRSTRLPITY